MSSNKSAARRVTAIVGTALLGLAACGGDTADDAAERAIERASGGAVDVEIDDAGGYRIETGDGTVDISMSGELPDEWPSDVPLPDGLVITGSSSIDGGATGRLVTLSGVISAPIEVVDSFYVGALSGWTEALRTTSASDGDRLFNVTYQRDERSLAVGGVDRDGQTEVGFTYTYMPSAGATDEPAPPVDVVGGLGIDGVDEALAAAGPDVVAGALVSALSADRYEIKNGTVHVYLGAGSGYDPMIACIAATAVVIDTPVVIHDGAGTETAC